jgi:hypothetical protein
MLRREYARRLRMQVLFSPIPDPRNGPLLFNKGQRALHSDLSGFTRALGMC